MTNISNFVFVTILARILNLLPGTHAPAVVAVRDCAMGEERGVTGAGINFGFFVSPGFLACLQGPQPEPPSELWEIRACCIRPNNKLVPEGCQVYVLRADPPPFATALFVATWGGIAPVTETELANLKGARHFSATDVSKLLRRSSSGDLSEHPNKRQRGLKLWAYRFANARKLDPALLVPRGKSTEACLCKTVLSFFGSLCAYFFFCCQNGSRFAMILHVEL